jgi:hypothetical protein
MLAPSPEYERLRSLENQTAPSESPEPLVKPAEEGDCVTDPDLSMHPFTGGAPEKESIVSVAPRLIP